MEVGWGFSQIVKDDIYEGGGGVMDHGEASVSQEGWSIFQDSGRDKRQHSLELDCSQKKLFRIATP